MKEKLILIGKKEIKLFADGMITYMLKIQKNGNKQTQWKQPAGTSE